MGEQLAVGKISNLMTALRLVHVMGRYQYRETLFGERMDLSPELASGRWINACGRFIQQQQFRVRERACAEREALLPAARKRPRQLFAACFQSQARDHGLRSPHRVDDTIHAPDEFEILAHGKIVIKTEALCHVADAALDPVGLGADVEAEARV